MKKLITIILAVTVSSFVFAQSENEVVMKELDAVKISDSDVPGPVIAQLKKDFPNGSPFQYYNIGETTKSKDWNISEFVDFDNSEGIDHYVIEMKGKNSYYYAMYDENGKLIMSRVWEKNVALPRPVMMAVNESYPGVGLKKDMHSKLVDHGKNKEYYVVTMDNGKKMTVSPDGKIMKK